MAPPFAKAVEKLGFEAHAPQYTEVYDLIANTCLEQGYQPGRKGRPSAYERLLSVAERVVAFVKRSKGRDGKQLARYADQLQQLLETWENHS